MTFIFISVTFHTYIGRTNAFDVSVSFACHFSPVDRSLIALAESSSISRLTDVSLSSSGLSVSIGNESSLSMSTLSLKVGKDERKDPPEEFDDELEHWDSVVVDAGNNRLLFHSVTLLTALVMKVYLRNRGNRFRSIGDVNSSLNDETSHWTYNVSNSKSFHKKYRQRFKQKCSLCEKHTS